MQNPTPILPFMLLGNGQLGRMLRYAGAPLDIHVQPLSLMRQYLIYLKMPSSPQKLNVGKNTFN